MTPPDTRIAVVGATGAVGREALAILAQWGVDARRVRAIASERSTGSRLPYADGELRVESPADGSFDGVTVALFAAGSNVSRNTAPKAIEAGAVVIDNSSAFRTRPDVPLVVPEINPEALNGGPRLVANPNCSTIILLTALEPLRRAFGIDEIIVSTYQAVSGAGAAAVDELHQQSRAALNGEQPQARVFHEPCAFNVFSHDSAVEPDTGVNGEERKIIDESRRIWADPALRISPACARVPVVRAHSQSVRVRLKRPASELQVRAALESGRGLHTIDDRAANRFPTPRKATGRDDVLVGRIRPDPAEPVENGSSRTWRLFVCADQLRKGAALNAIQIARSLSLI